MTEYRINGYDLFLAFGIAPDQDRSTSDSFDTPSDVVPVFFHVWADGVVEYDLLAQVHNAPKVFTIKGVIIVDSLQDYIATKLAIEAVFKQNYVTLLQKVTVDSVVMETKSNARMKPGSLKWNRLTRFDALIATAIEVQFDEVLQNVPFKEDGGEGTGITYYVDNEGDYLLTEGDENYIS